MASPGIRVFVFTLATIGVNLFSSKSDDGSACFIMYSSPGLLLLWLSEVVVVECTGCLPLMDVLEGKEDGVKRVPVGVK